MQTIKNTLLNTMSKKNALALLFITATPFVYAEDKEAHHGPHQHGVAEMNVVWEKQDLNIELRSPAFNITGFEHQPNNHEQEEMVEKIEKLLNSPKDLFTFSGASCESVKKEINSPFEEHAEHEQHKEKQGDKDHEHEEHAKHDDHDEHAKHDDHDEHAKHDDHDEHEDHAKHDDHDEHAKHDDHDEHEDHDHESSTHSEYSINYEFSCADSKAELTISAANLFKQLPQMQKINVQWLSATQQSSSILNKDNTTLTLK